MGSMYYTVTILADSRRLRSQVGRACTEDVVECVMEEKFREGLQGTSGPREVI